MPYGRIPDPLALPTVTFDAALIRSAPEFRVLVSVCEQRGMAWLHEYLWRDESSASRLHPRPSPFVRFGNDALRDFPVPCSQLGYFDYRFDGQAIHARLPDGKVLSAQDGDEFVFGVGREPRVEWGGDRIAARVAAALPALAGAL